MSYEYVCGLLGIANPIATGLCVGGLMVGSAVLQKKYGDKVLDWFWGLFKKGEKK